MTNTYEPGALVSLLLLGAPRAAESETLSNTYESITNMNETNAKHAKWCLRVLNPQLQPYTFQSRGQTVNAKQFTCVLVGDTPSECMIGTVPFEFRSPIRTG